MPSVEGEDFSEDMPHVHDMLVSTLGPKENDFVIIGSGENKTSAEIGAKKAAFKLLKATTSVT